MRNGHIDALHKLRYIKFLGVYIGISMPIWRDNGFIYYSTDPAGRRQQ